ncbi:MAG: Holliday junction branch migration protein RuvA [Ignavibacteria bacterium]|nr:Holliday junction branch migration protein RuvA [Ignavibacteria bacterium]
MISFIKGHVVQKNPTRVVIESNGIGYSVNISLNTFEKLPEVNSEVKLYAILIPREDAFYLYGFSDELEKQMFELLISVSGIGPKVAQGVLSRIIPSELIDFISHGNISALTSIPGIGKKTAERLIVELKDKLAKLPSEFEQKISVGEDIRIQAYHALVTLGYQKQIAEKAIRSALSEIKNEDLSVEILLKKSLQSLNK